MKKSSKILISLVSALAVFVVVVCVYFNSLCKAKDSKQNAVSQRIQVPEGTSIKTLGKELENLNLIKSDFAFYYGARFSVFNKLFVHSQKKLQLKSGYYKISSDMSIAEIYDYLTSGKQEYIKVSFPEGLTKSKIAFRLEESGVCEAEKFKKAVVNPEIIASYSLPTESLEGYLFPDTYFLTPMMEAESVVRVMVDNFFEHVKDIPVLKDMSVGDLDYMVRLASIVEREYRIDEEAPLIASVFKNRLRRNIGLYSCATIEYVITEIEGRPHPDKITWKDLQIDSPYNTYLWAGLPPTAISNPGVIALTACANAPRTKYYYFRLINEDEGRHVFTEDFSQHISEGYSISTKKAGK